MSLSQYLQDRKVVIRDLSIRISLIILITICLSIGVINTVSMAYGAGTKTSSRHVENATGHHQNATALGKHSGPPLNHTGRGTIVGTIVGSVITLAGDLYDQIANCLKEPTCHIGWWGYSSINHM